MKRAVNAALSTLFTLGLGAQTLPTAWELALPDAKYMAAIDNRRVRESSIAQSLHAQFAGRDPSGALTAQFPWLKGLADLTKDSDRVFLSSSGVGSIGGVQPSNVLFVVEGIFQPAHLQPLLQGSSRTYRGVNVYRTAAESDTSLALLTERVILFGDEKSVLGALDRWGRSTTTPNANLARAAAAMVNNDVWMLFPDARSIKPPSARNAGFEPVQIEIGVSYGETISMQMNYVFATEARAAQFARGASAALGSAPRQQQNERTGYAALRRMQVTSAGNQVSLRTYFNKEESIGLAENALAGMNPLQPGSVTNATAQAVLPADAPKPETEPPGPKKIRIYGLDEGVREIPTPH
jgi:hypothetical protein